jgi:hypothetical protein
MPCLPRSWVVGALILIGPIKSLFQTINRYEPENFSYPFAEIVRIANVSAVGDMAVGLIDNPNREVMDVKITLVRELYSRFFFQVRKV